jgi:hypothetical protein
MKQLSILFLFGLPLFTSCKKDNTESTIFGQWNWTIQRENNPAYNSTPQSTGVTEVFIFNTNGTYSLTQNNMTLNSGTYKISSATNMMDGSMVTSILFTNQRVTDSVAYYSLNNDNLFFSLGLIGLIGGSERHYSRK